MARRHIRIAKRICIRGARKSNQKLLTQRRLSSRAKAADVRWIVREDSIQILRMLGLCVNRNGSAGQARAQHSVHAEPHRSEGPYEGLDCEPRPCHAAWEPCDGCLCSKEEQHARNQVRDGYVAKCVEYQTAATIGCMRPPSASPANSDSSKKLYARA